MSLINDDELLNGEDEFDYEDYNLDGDQEEELLQDDIEEDDDDLKDKSKSYGEVEDEEDVLTLDVDDEERLEKSLSEDTTKKKENIRFIENKPKPIPTTTNNVNSKKNSPIKPRDRPPPTTKTLTSHEKTLNGKKNQRKIDNSRRGGKAVRGSFNGRPKSDFQKRRNGTVLINPRYKGTVSVNDTARLAWDVNSQPPANYIQPWATGVPTPSNNANNIQDTLLNLVSHLRNSVDVPPNNFNLNIPVQQNDYFQPPPPLQRNVFENLPIFGQAAATAPSQMQPNYGQTQHAPQWESYYLFNQNQLPTNSYGGGDVQNQFSRSNDRLQIDNRLFNSFDQYTNSNQGRNENFQSECLQPNYYSNYRNQDTIQKEVRRNDYGGANLENNNLLNDYRSNRNTNNYNRNNKPVFVRGRPNNNSNTINRGKNNYDNDKREKINCKTDNDNINRKKIETNATPKVVPTEDLVTNSPKKARLQVVSPDRLMYRVAENKDPMPHKRIMFEEKRSASQSEATSESIEDEEMRLYRLQIEEQKRLREQVLRRKEENRKKLMEQRLKEEERKKEAEEVLKNQEEERVRIEQERLRHLEEEEERRKQQLQQMSINAQFVQPMPVQQRVFSAPKVPPVTICKPKFETPLPKASKFERPRENITIIPTDDFTNTKFTISNNLTKQVVANDTQSSNMFRTNRVITVKNNPSQKHTISSRANPVAPGVDSSSLTFSNTNTLNFNDSTKGSGSGTVDDFSSFFNNRKVLKNDKHLLKTRLVTVSNLSASTDQKKLESLTQGMGEIQKLRLDTAERKATILFKTVATAQNFYKKYQRHMLDLSMIEVKLEPML